MSSYHRPIAAQRGRNVRIREHAERVARTVPVSADAPAVPVAVVPANTRETEPLPAATRVRFLDGLGATLRLSFSSAMGGRAEPLTAEETAAITNTEVPHDQSDAMRIVGRACGTCRGECCTAGGDHAFLRAESLMRVRSQHPTLGEEALLAAYASLLPVRHYRGSCVYHTTDGCALPRDMRSNLCNRYLCGGLTQLKNALEAGGGSLAFVGASDSVHLRRLALVTPTSSTPIPLKET